LQSAASQDEAASLLCGLPFANAIRFDILPIEPMMPFVRFLDDRLVRGRLPNSPQSVTRDAGRESSRKRARIDGGSRLCTLRTVLCRPPTA
jgi:hypothetical protein